MKRFRLSALFLILFVFSCQFRSLKPPVLQPPPVERVPAYANLAPSELAILPLNIHADPKYGFDIFLRRGYDYVAAALVQAFSAARPASPAGIDAVFDRSYYSARPQAPAPADACGLLRTSRLYLADVFVEEKGLRLELRDFDCESGQPGGFSQTLSADTVTPDAMEKLCLRGAKETAREVYRRQPGPAGFLTDGPEPDDAAVTERLKQIFPHGDPSDNPFSNLGLIAQLAQLTRDYPAHPLPWINLSYRWSTMGSDLKLFTWRAEEFFLPGYAAFRVAQMLIARPGYERFQDPEAHRTGIAYHIAGNKLFTYVRFDRTGIRPMDGGYSTKDPNYFRLVHEQAWKVYKDGEWGEGIETGARLTLMSSLYGTRAIAMQQELLQAGQDPLLPDPKDPELTRLAAAEPGLTPREMADAEGTSFISVAQFHRLQNEFHNQLIKAQRPEPPLSRVNAGPEALGDYLDGYNFIGIVDIHRGYWGLGAYDGNEQLRRRLVELYPGRPEPILFEIIDASCGEIMARAGEMENLPAYYLDSENILRSFAEKADCYDTGVMPESFLRVAYRWPYLNLPMNFVLDGLVKLPGPLFDEVQKAAIAAYPDYTGNDVRLAHRAQWLGDFARSEEILLDVVRRQPYFGFALQQLGYHYYYYGKFAEGLAFCAQHKKSTSLPRKRILEAQEQYDALAQLELDDLPKAKTSIYRAGCYAGAAEAYLGLRPNPAKALPLLQKASEEDNWKADTIVAWAKYYAAIGDTAKANAEWKRSYDRYPDSQYSLLYYVRSLTSQKKFAEADKELVNLLKLKPDTRTLIVLWELRISQGQNPDPKDFHLELFDPGMQARVLYWIGMWRVIEGADPAGAAAMEDRLKRDFPGNAYGPMLACQRALAAGDFPGAETLAEGLTGNRSFDPKMMNYLLLRALLGQKKTEAAKKLAAEVHRLAPGHSFDLLVAAELAMATGRLDEARRVLTDLAPRPFLVYNDEDRDPHLRYYCAQAFLKFLELSDQPGDREMVLLATGNNERVYHMPYHAFSWFWDYSFGRYYRLTGDREKATEFYRQALAAAPGFKLAADELAGMK